ncbi:MAG TPA: S9 family peptidase [Streptosporangiaceae bacterium]|nr:S9 family peptidase [Streptosporangiaceae bacterium]
MADMSVDFAAIDFGQRDLRGTALYGFVEDHFRRLHEPAYGAPSAAADADGRPDGAAIAFTGTIFTELAGLGKSRVCLAEGGAVAVLTDGPGEQTHPRFSPDGTLLAYLSDAAREGDFQLRIRVLADGSERTPDPAGGTVEYLEFSPDGRRVLLGVAGHGADRSGGEGSGTTARLASDLPDWMPEANAGPAGDQWRSAWVTDVVSGATRQVTKPGTNVWEATWDGQGALLAVTSPAPGEEAWYTASLHRIDLATGAEDRLYAGDNQMGWPAASPSGGRWAIVTATCSDRWIVAGDLRVADGSGAPVPVDTHGADVTAAQWLDESRVGYLGLRGLLTVAGIYDAATGMATETWSSAETTGDRYPQGRFLPDGSVACVVHSYDRYPELSFVRGGDVVTVASLRHPGADYLAAAGGRIEPVSWPAPDGLEIQGLLCVPDRPGPHPLIVFVHGGPVWAYRSRWSMGYVYTPLLVRRGYAVLHPNPRGSAGRGQDFARAVLGDMGGADTYDYLSGIDALVERGIADPDRVGVTGGSYGGFMSAWLITQDQRFAAAVPMAPCTDWFSQHHTTNIPYFDALFLADKPRARTGRYLDRSPLLFADQVTTPTLQTTGALDRCTPPGQAVEFHTALLECGVESALAIYPGEGHGVRRFPALVDQCARLLGWFERHMPA